MSSFSDAVAQTRVKLKTTQPSRERPGNSAAVRRTMQQATQLISPEITPGQCIRNSGGGELHSITRHKAP